MSSFCKHENACSEAGSSTPRPLQVVRLCQAGAQGWAPSLHSLRLQEILDREGGARSGLGSCGSPSGGLGRAEPDIWGSQWEHNPQGLCLDRPHGALITLPLHWGICVCAQSCLLLGATGGWVTPGFPNGLLSGWVHGISQDGAPVIPDTPPLRQVSMNDCGSHGTNMEVTELGAQRLRVPTPYCKLG